MSTNSLPQGTNVTFRDVNLRNRRGVVVEPSVDASRMCRVQWAGLPYLVTEWEPNLLPVN